MNISSGIVKFFAALAMVFGFVVGGLEVYVHYIREGESAWAFLPFLIAAISITWGALMLQRDDTSAALDKLIEVIPIFGAFLASRRIGGRRDLDPPPSAEGLEIKKTLEIAASRHKKPKDPNA